MRSLVLDISSLIQAGTAIVWFVGLNIFGDMMPAMLGRVLTAIIVGGGSELLHKIIEAAGDLATK